MPDSNIGPRPTRGVFPQKNSVSSSLSNDRNDCIGRPRTRLLVSVRSAEEALVAVEADADIIDVKEPMRGPLGAADAEVWRHIAAVVDDSRPLSAALGEAIELAPKQMLESALGALPRAFRFAKLGPAGTGSLPAIESLWRRIQACLPDTTEFVSVAYADWRTAGCRPPEELLALAAGLGARWWLLDTFEKRGATVIDLLGVSRLAEIAQQARSLSMQWALAGSLRRHAEPVWRAWKPDVVGVRGDVCRGRREGAIDPEAIGHWKNLLQSELPV